MIRKFSCIWKMQRYFLLFSLFFAATRADGKFAVLQAPKALLFRGAEAVESSDVGDILSASTGNTIYGDAAWSGMLVVDPFNMPEKVVVFLVDGVALGTLPSTKFEYPMTGDSADASLNTLITEMKAAHVSTCDINYDTTKASTLAYKCLGNSVKPTEEPELPTTTALNPENVAAKQFLETIANLNDAVDNFETLKETQNATMRDVVIIRISLECITRAFGQSSPQSMEATELLKDSISNVQRASDDSMVVVISQVQASKSRSKRETVAPSATENPFNLAEYHDENYPVIFNIILWFMVAFSFSLLAISYAIGSMDPGRDSIIYRMTSTRMKKDN